MTFKSHFAFCCSVVLLTLCLGIAPAKSKLWCRCPLLVSTSEDVHFYDEIPLDPKQLSKEPKLPIDAYIVLQAKAIERGASGEAETWLAVVPELEDSHLDKPRNSLPPFFNIVVSYNATAGKTEEYAKGLINNFLIPLQREYPLANILVWERRIEVPPPGTITLLPVPQGYRSPRWQVPNDMKKSFEKGLPTASICDGNSFLGRSAYFEVLLGPSPQPVLDKCDRAFSGRITGSRKNKEQILASQTRVLETIEQICESLQREVQDLQREVGEVIRTSSYPPKWILLSPTMSFAVSSDPDLNMTGTSVDIESSSFRDSLSEFRARKQGDIWDDVSHSYRYQVTLADRMNRLITASRVIDSNSYTLNIPASTLTKTPTMTPSVTPTKAPSVTPTSTLTKTLTKTPLSTLTERSFTPIPTVQTGRMVKTFQVGAFEIEENAQKLKARLERKGFQVFIQKFEFGHKKSLRYGVQVGAFKPEDTITSTSLKKRLREAGYPSVITKTVRENSR